MDIDKINELSPGVYSGYEDTGRSGWLLKIPEGECVFFIKGFSDGLISNHLIEEAVSSIEKQLWPHSDYNEFKQLSDLIIEIWKKQPQTIDLLVGFKKILQIHSLFMYGDSNHYQFPLTDNNNDGV